MNFRLNIILLVIVAALGGWYLSQQNNDQNGLDNLIKQEGKPDYTGRQMATEIYDLQGKPQYSAKAAEIKRYESTERTEFLKPLVNLFNATTALKEWELSADNAEITKEKILHLSGNVYLQALEPTSRLQRIETDKLSIDLNTQDVFTDSIVKSKGLGFTTMGRGLKGNLKQQNATLLNDVKTYLEPTVIKETQAQESKSDK